MKQEEVTHRTKVMSVYTRALREWERLEVRWDRFAAGLPSTERIELSDKLDVAFVDLDKAEQQLIDLGINPEVLS